VNLGLSGDQGPAAQRPVHTASLPVVPGDLAGLAPG
jgi:hypothetical protein